MSSLEDLNGYLTHQAGFIHSYEDPEDCFTLPPAIGSGSVSTLGLRDGLWLVRTAMDLAEGRRIRLTPQYPHLEVLYVLEGAIEFRLANGESHRVDQSAGQLLYLPSSTVDLELAKGRCVALSLRVDLRSYQLPVGTAPWSQEQGLFRMALSLQPGVQLLMNQIARCPFACGVKRLYLEGKAFELLAHSLSEVGGQPATQVLHPADRQKIIEARKILIAKLVNPPSIIALARQIGLNDFKLKKGFREVFGTTVYGLVRTERLSRAKDLIESGHSNVSEAAVAVGYENLSHFARAFKLEFGINPSQLRATYSTGRQS